MNAPVEHLFLVPIAIQLVLLLLAGALYRKRGYHDLRPPKVNIFRCTKCRHIYIDNRRVPLSKCPKCNTLNERIRR